MSDETYTDASGRRRWVRPGIEGAADRKARLQPAPASSLGIIRAMGLLAALMRVRQWPKNALVFAPLFLDHQPSLLGMIECFILFAAFCSLSSVVYIINDMADAEHDRLHPTKRNRPIASGAVSRRQALFVLGSLVLTTTALSTLLAVAIIAMMIGYIAINVLYSFRFKKVPILEIFFVSVGFVIRVAAGSEAAGAPVPAEILAFVFFFCAFISVGKRRRELTHAAMGSVAHRHRNVLKFYNVAFLDSLLLVTVIMSGVFFWMHLFISMNEASQLASIFAGVCGMAIVSIIFRYLQAIYVDSTGGDPVSFLVRDRFIVGSSIICLCSYWLLMHQV